MKEYLRGYFIDLNGPEEEELPWQFHGSSSVMGEFYFPGFEILMATVLGDFANENAPHTQDFQGSVSFSTNP